MDIDELKQKMHEDLETALDNYKALQTNPWPEALNVVYSFYRSNNHISLSRRQSVLSQRFYQSSIVRDMRNRLWTRLCGNRIIIAFAYTIPKPVFADYTGDWDPLQEAEDKAQATLVANNLDKMFRVTSSRYFDVYNQYEVRTSCILKTNEDVHNLLNAIGEPLT